MIFLKLGGSLITVKDEAETARPEVLARIATEIAGFITEQPEQRLLLGHGSGSFGHAAAARHKLGGPDEPGDWEAYWEVWAAARRLHDLVMQALIEAGLPAISMPPSASGLSADGKLEQLAVEPIEHALRAGLLPVVQGDVIFDRHRGAAIISTEAVFAFLAKRLRPDRLLLAGAEAGVYADYPDRQQLLDELTRRDLAGLPLLGAAEADVTGGMRDKVERSLQLVEALPGLDAWIFSGHEPGSVTRALAGQPTGTRLRAASD